MAGKAGFEPGIIASRAQRSTIKLFPSMAGADRIELPSRILEIRSIAISPCPLGSSITKKTLLPARSLLKEFRYSPNKHLNYSMKRPRLLGA